MFRSTLRRLRAAIVCAITILLAGISLPARSQASAIPQSVEAPRVAEAAFQIVEISISKFVPAEVYPGQPFSVAIQAITRGQASASKVQSRLEVVFSQSPGTARMPALAYPPSVSASAVPEKHEIYLLATAPSDLPAPPIQSSFSIVDRADGRVFVSAVLPVLTPAQAPQTLRVFGQDISLTGSAVFVAAFAAFGGFLFSVINAIRARREASQLKSELESARFEERTAQWHESVPSPVGADDILPELASSLQTGEMLLFIGSHLGEVVKEPPLSEVLRRLVPSQNLSASEATLVTRALARGDYGRAADLVVQPGQEEQLAKELRRIYRGSSPGSIEADMGDLPPIYQLLSGLPFTGVLTTTWSSRVEEAFAHQKPRVISPGSKNPTSALESDQFFVLHLWGALRGDTPPLISGAQVARYQRDGSFYARFLQSLVGGRAILFIGATPNDIESVLSIGDQKARPDCFAFMPEQMLGGQSRLIAELLKTRYGVRISPYPATLGDDSLIKSLQELRHQVGERPAQPPSLAARRQFTALTLTNIGPFATLQVDFKAAWNIILGDNACGKSTILRAIALGLCGDAPQAAEPGGALLKSGATEGRVELQVGSETYVTSLYREDDGIRLMCSGLTPVQRGGWVVLGFPPLRGVRLKHAERQTSFADPRQPQVGDVMPLLSGGVDVRVDDLCQWIASMSKTERGKQLLGAFFGVLSDLAPSNQLALSRIDSTGQVFVTTSDGEIPIDAVSQGMSSTIGWVGTLLQRLYEIYPDSEHPEAEPALILVDEIDAHLHPAWQRALVGLVQRHFKGLQVIATTHSPLVVGGMNSDDVLVTRRDPAEPTRISVVRASAEVNLEGLRADQILTSPLFGMRSTRSEKDGATTRRYSQLLGIEKRNAEEEREFLELRVKMDKWMSEEAQASASGPIDTNASVARAEALPISDADARIANDRMASFLAEEDKR